MLQLLNAKLHYVAISGVENGFFGEIFLPRLLYYAVLLYYFTVLLYCIILLLSHFNVVTFLFL